MKKGCIIFGSLLVFISCNNASTDTTTKSADTVAVAPAAPAAPAADPEVAKGLGLIGKSDCLTCHKLPNL